MKASTRPRLKQMPLVMEPGLRFTVELLSPKARRIALELHQLMLDDGRTWLEATYAAAQAQTFPPALLDAVLSGARHRAPSAARRAAWLAVRQGTGGRISLPTIGRAFGGYHHSSVLAGIRLAEHEAKLAAETMAAVEALAAGERAA